MFPHRVVLVAGLAALVTAAACASTAFLPAILTGPVVSNANARGTALVMLLGGVPLLLLGLRAAIRGSWRGSLVVLGALAYLLYNDVMLVFATPFNRLFLVYEAAFALTLFAAISALLTVDLRAIADSIGELPTRRLAVYGWVVIGLNTLAWLGSVGPATLAADPTSFLEGTGVATNPVIAQDFAFWLPGAALVAALLWQRRPAGVVLFGAWLVYGIVESVGVAVDQTLGYLADPVAAQAAPVGVAIFLALAAIGLVPLFVYLRRRPDENQAASRRAMMLRRT